MSVTIPSLSRLSQSASSLMAWDLQRLPSRHPSREEVAMSELNLNAIAAKFTIDMRKGQAEVEKLVRRTRLQYFLAHLLDHSTYRNSSLKCYGKN